MRSREPSASSRSMDSWSPSATLRLVPECGHAPMLERPDIFARAVEEFLDSLAPTPARVS
jgi:pimeloyl-ACP methyl ester carboxylesterase